jgi:pimeloyl-ACP methyl ester carboxylesterase
MNNEMTIGMAGDGHGDVSPAGSRTGAPGLLTDFGGEGPVVHVAHANGLPPGTYRLLAERLVASYHVIGLAARPLWPGSEPRSAPSWRTLADDLIRGLDELGLRGIWGVGHSLGGVLTLIAAVQRPELFRAVVMIDPVILPPRRMRALRLMNLVGMQRRVPLVRSTLNRRRTWASREECLASLAGKPFFATWPAESLRAYVDSGTRERADGQVELVYPPEWEAHIFATAPTYVWPYVRKLGRPSLWIRGERSPTFCDVCVQRVQRLLPGAQALVIPDSGHMVPLERPGETAEAIREFLGAVREA